MIDSLQPPNQYLDVERPPNDRERSYDVAWWVVASLFLLNGGALLALSGILREYPVAATDGAAKLVWGAVFAALTGIFTWAGCFVGGRTNGPRLSALALPEKVSWLLLFGTFASAFASAVLFGFGGQAIIDGLREQQAIQSEGPPPLSPAIPQMNP